MSISQDYYRRQLIRAWPFKTHQQRGQARNVGGHLTVGHFKQLFKPTVSSSSKLLVLFVVIVAAITFLFWGYGALFLLFVVLSSQRLLLRTLAITDPIDGFKGIHYNESLQGNGLLEFTINR